MRIGSRESAWADFGATRTGRPARAPEAGAADPRPPTEAGAGEAAPAPRLGPPPKETLPLGQREPDYFMLGKRTAAPGTPSEEPVVLGNVAAAADQAAEPLTRQLASAAATDAGQPKAKAAAESDQASDAASESPGDKSAKAPGDKRLSADEQAQVEALRQRDREVRAHEAAHAAAAGSMGGGASYEYQVGPDGRNYAVGGEVPVRTGTPRTPEEAIRAAAQLRAAALAPAEPSAQDRAVAAQATAMESAARAEMAARRAELNLRTAEFEMEASRAPRADKSGGNGDDKATSGISGGEASSRAAQSIERDRMLRELETEQRLQRGGWQHLHTETSCASCSSAVASYR